MTGTPVPRNSFSLKPRAGAEIRGDVRRSEENSGRTAVVVVHGFKGFKDWGFFPYVCERLAEAGHTVVSFNLSGNGIGEDPLEFTELEKFGANTFTVELEDIRAVLDALWDGTIPAPRPERIGLLGHSRGGGQAVVTAAEDDRIQALVTWAAVATFDRWTEEAKRTWRADGRIWIANQRTGQQMPLDVSLLEDFEANRERLDIRAAARRITAPWLVVHGTNDETVDIGDGRALVDAGPQARSLWVEGAGHTFEARHPFEGPPPELLRAIEGTVDHFQHALAG